MYAEFRPQRFGAKGTEMSDTEISLPGIDPDEEWETCERCGADLLGGVAFAGGCPECMPCSGQYAAGTEECDFCEFEKECARDYMRAITR